MSLRNLSLITAILFVASIFVYVNENKRGTDLLAGSDYIKGLDINEIQKIILTFDDDKKLSLSRDSKRFVLDNHKSYPASTDKVNDLIYKIASIQVKERVDSEVDEKDLVKYELGSDQRKYQVELFDSEGKRTVAFSVGKSQKGKGNFLTKEGTKEVYLSKQNLILNSSYKDFISTFLLELKKDDIEKVSLSADKNIEFVKKDNQFVIETPGGDKFKKEKVEEYTGSFSSIQFDDFFSIDEPQIRSLSFDRDIKIHLKNRLIYRVSLAKDKEDYFVRLSALMEDPQKKFVVSQNDGKEELKKIEDVIQAQEKAQKINSERAPWVYKVDKAVYEKLAKGSKFFL